MHSSSTRKNSMDTSKVPKKSRDEVVRQTNASSGTEEEEEESDPGYDSSNESDSGEEDQDSSSIIDDCPEISKPPVRHTRPLSIKGSTKPMARGMHQGDRSMRRKTLRPGVDFAKLETNILRLYCAHYNLMRMNSGTPREEMLSAVQCHFSLDLGLNEKQVIMDFIKAARRSASG